jgi:nucleotide-binding universal stress UspA family protein
MGPIVCGVDFSEDSKRALRWADLMARRLGQPLIVVHAVEPLLANAAQVEYGEGAIEAQLLPELKEFVEQSIGEHQGTELKLGIGGADRIVRGTALSTDAGMIVLGTQGLGHAGRLWFGSTTARVLRETTRPVLAVPPAKEGHTDDTPQIDEIIVGTDFGPASRAAAAAAEELGKLFGVGITALHAVPEVAAPARWSNIVAQAVEEGVREARRQMGESVPAHWTSDVRTGSAASVLVDAASGKQALIVVGLSGNQSENRPGTTAYRVLLDADAPVLAVPGG